MQLRRLTPLAALTLASAGCVDHEVAAPSGASDHTNHALIRTELAVAGDHFVTGYAPPPREETGHAPRYELYLERARGDRSRPLGIEAIDAAYDAETRMLAWIDPVKILYVAPIASAPEGAREVASEVSMGMAAASGRLAFAVEINFPESSPFVYDLRTSALMPLDGGDGPNEILAFSPDGESVLLLSGRTGLASLFDASIRGDTAVQLTNAGLRPGPELDQEAFVPPPLTLRDVTWGPRGIAYQARDTAIWIRPDGAIERLGADTPIEEVVR
jgi:hypothetical protein